MKTRVQRQAFAIFIAMLVASVSSAGTAPAAAAAPTPLNSADHSLLFDALSTNQLQVDMSAYAATHASSDKVRKFAQKMVGEHTLLGAEIQKANDGVVPVPGKTDQPDATLNGQKDDAFDRVYVSVMTTDDDTLLARWQAAAEGTLHGQTIRDTAKKIVPTLRRLDAAAQDVQRSL